MDAEGVPGLGVVLVELLPGLKGVAIGGRALGVDGGVDQIGTALTPRLLKALGEDIGVQLGVSWDLGAVQQHLKELVGSEIKAVHILPVAHCDGEGEDLDLQLLPQSGGDIGSGVGRKLDTSHGRPPYTLG